ncbi:2549_t:CDS:2 [Entrophospora sp. SA101]|nr:2549_t:CDS:2 [Entrophospora sp. SA101]
MKAGFASGFNCFPCFLEDLRRDFQQDIQEHGQLKRNIEAQQNPEVKELFENFLQTIENDLYPGGKGKGNSSEIKIRKIMEKKQIRGNRDQVLSKDKGVNCCHVAIAVALFFGIAVVVVVGLFLGYTVKINHQQFVVIKIFKREEARNNIKLYYTVEDFAKLQVMADTEKTFPHPSSAEFAKKMKNHCKIYPNYALQITNQEGLQILINIQVDRKNPMPLGKILQCEVKEGQEVNPKTPEVISKIGIFQKDDKKCFVKVYYRNPYAKLQFKKHVLQDIYKDISEEEFMEERKLANHLVKKLLPKQKIKIRFVEELEDSRKYILQKRKVFKDALPHEFAHAANEVRFHPDYNPNSTLFSRHCSRCGTPHPGKGHDKI